MEKSWSLKKKRIILKNHGILCNNLTKPPVARKLAVGHLCVRQLVCWLLAVSSFNFFKMHAWSTSMLLLLHSAFMLSVVKMLLKWEDGDREFNSHGNYIVDHGKSWKNHGIVFWIPVGTLFKPYKPSFHFIEQQCRTRSDPAECGVWSVGRPFRLGGWRVASSRLRSTVLCPWARYFILCLLLVQPRKTGKWPNMTETLLTGM